MTVNTPKQREWVRVPQAKGKFMCSDCGQRGSKYDAVSFKYMSWCNDVDKACRDVAMRCVGPFIREDKIKQVLKYREMLL